MTSPKLKTFLMVSNYNADISWILDYTDNYIIYDRSDTDEWIKSFDISKVIKVPNIGWDIYDKFTYIIDHYDNLPDTLILAKGNLFKYITREEFDEICNNTTFTPLFTRHHPTKFPTAFYGDDGIYNEINNSWYLGVYPAKYFKTYNSFIWRYFKKIPKYIKFGPGSNYLVQKEDITRYPKSFYEKLRSYISYSAHPGEAQIIERTLYYLWNGDLNLKLPWYYKTINYSHVITQNIMLSIKKSIPISFKKILRKIPAKLRYYRTEIYVWVRNIINTIKMHFTWNSPAQIAEYRKKIKIYDIFTYNGEIDILEIRLNILKDYVDEFIIVEAPTTFSGLNKPLYFKEEEGRFRSFSNKIKYFVIDDYPNDIEICRLADTSSNVPKDGPEHWKREFYQKESIKKALTNLRDDDICFVGDVDEIWNPNVLIDYTKDDIFKLRQDVYAYYLNNRSSEPWAGTLVTKYKNIKSACLNHLRTKGKTKYTYLRGGGWHFTSMGGIEELRRKLNDSYTKESYNTDEVQQGLEKRFGTNDYMGRNFQFWIDEFNLPKYILDKKEKYKKLFK